MKTTNKDLYRDSKQNRDFILCATCGKRQNVHRSQIEGTSRVPKRKYCSNSCRHKGIRKESVQNVVATDEGLSSKVVLHDVEHLHGDKSYDSVI